MEKPASISVSVGRRVATKSSLDTQLLLQSAVAVGVSSTVQPGIPQLETPNTKQIL